MSITRKSLYSLGADRLGEAPAIEVITSVGWSGSGNTLQSLAYSGAEDADYVLAVFGPSGAITPGVDIEGVSLDLLFSRTSSSRMYVMGAPVSDIPGFTGSGDADVTFVTSQTYQNVSVIFLKNATSLDETPVLSGGSGSAVTTRLISPPTSAQHIMAYAWRTNIAPGSLLMTNSTIEGWSTHTGPSPDIHVGLVVQTEVEETFGNSSATSEDGYAVFRLL